MDERTVDQLLDGATEPDRPPESLVEIARLVHLAKAPGAEAELASAPAAIEKLVQVVRNRSDPAGMAPAAGQRPKKERRMLINTLRFKLASLVVAGGLASFGSAAVAGALPGGIQLAVADAASYVGIHLPDPGARKTDVNTASAAPSKKELRGLCQAWIDQQATGTGNLGARPMGVLRSAASAAGEPLDTFCTQLISAAHQAKQPDSSKQPQPKQPKQQGNKQPEQQGNKQQGNKQQGNKQQGNKQQGNKQPKQQGNK